MFRLMTNKKIPCWKLTFTSYSYSGITSRNYFREFLVWILNSFASPAFIYKNVILYTIIFYKTLCCCIIQYGLIIILINSYLNEMTDIFYIIFVCNHLSVEFLGETCNKTHNTNDILRSNTIVTII